MTAFVHHLAYDFRSGLRDRSLMLMNYLFPLVFYAMMGLLMTGINPGFSQTIVPAMIVNAIMSSALLGLPNPIVAERETGILRSYKINGVPAISLVIIPVLGVTAHMLLVAGLVTASAPLLFDGLLPSNWPAFIGITLLAVLTMGALGMLIGVVSANARTPVLLAQVLYIPSMMLGGLMLPVSMLPDSLERVAALLPATHVMNAYNHLAFAPADLAAPTIDPLASVVVLAASGLLALGLSVYLFSWDTRVERRRPVWLALIALLPYLAALVLLG